MIGRRFLFGEAYMETLQCNVCTAYNAMDSQLMGMKAFGAGNFRNAIAHSLGVVAKGCAEFYSLLVDVFKDIDGSKKMCELLAFVISMHFERQWESFKKSFFCNAQLIRCVVF
jgi:hypothetical protein